MYTNPRPTYAQIANDYRLWQKYVDPGAVMTPEEFNGLTTQRKINMQIAQFGPEEPQRPKPHSPGPWTHDAGGWEFIRASDGSAIIYGDQEGGLLASDEDARLIAAAPELLEALKEALRVMTEWQVGHSVRMQASAAIAKATGSD